MWAYNPTAELYHHGILGQKWGVRRFQNKDGTRTAAGKARERKQYASEMTNDELRKKINRMRDEQRYMELAGKNSSVVSKVSGGVEGAANIAGRVNGLYKNFKGDKNNKYNGVVSNGINAASSSARLAKKVDRIVTSKNDYKRIRSNIDKMSDSDLRREIERLDLEQQYNRLQKSSINRGKVHVQEVLSVAGDVVSIGASAVMMAAGIKKLLGR